MTTDPAAGGPAGAPGGADAGGEGATLLITGTGMVAISAPTALQVLWLIAVCGVAAARALGRRTGGGPTPGGGAAGGPGAPGNGGGVPPQ